MTEPLPALPPAPDADPAAVRVALLGFSAFERNALTAYLHLTRGRIPRYVHAMDIDDATFIVADGDEAGVMALLRKLGRTPDSVFVGSSSPSGSAGWLMRPVDPAQVVRELDQLIAKRRDGAGQDSPTSEFAASSPALFDALPSGPSRLDSDAPVRRRDDDRQPLLRPLSARRAGELDLDLSQGAPLRRSRLPEPGSGRALVIDDSELARHFLRRELGRYGLTIDTAAGSDEALTCLAEQPYELVFLDVDLGQASTLNGFSLCHRIRHLPLPAGQRPPTVVLVTAFHQPADKVRATLAGAETVLAKPLDFPALEQLMRRHGHFRVGVPRGRRR